MNSNNTVKFDNKIDITYTLTRNETEILFTVSLMMIVYDVI